MDRQQFYAAIVRYETHLNRQGNWAVGGLFLAIVAPMIVVFTLPLESRPSVIVSTIAAIAILVLYGYALRIFNRRAATKFGMLCQGCRVVLDLRHIGFTGVCRECGSRAFTESNPLLQPTGQKPPAAE
jgi:hypothetical protein